LETSLQVPLFLYVNEVTSSSDINSVVTGCRTPLTPPDMRQKSVIFVRRSQASGII